MIIKYVNTSYNNLSLSCNVAAANRNSYINKYDQEMMTPVQVK